MMGSEVGEREMGVGSGKVLKPGFKLWMPVTMLSVPTLY